MCMYRTFWLGLAAAGLAIAPAAAKDAAPIGAIVAQAADEGDYMGAALVVRGDEMLLDKAYGSANLEWGIANTTDTKFRIGSVTKQFTAVAILMLAERGQVDLDQPIGTYLGDAPEAWAPITVRQLLVHTSGIPNVTDLEDFETFKYLPTTRDGLIERFAQLPLEFEPGSQWAYSNSNYVLLTAIVEETGGQPYADFVAEHLFAPAGMNDTAIDVSEEIVPRRASGYTPGEDGLENADYVNMGIPMGAGALYSTTHDLHKWQQALFGGALISADSLAAYVTPAPFETSIGSAYALGILVDDDDGGTLYWHGGGIEGFNAYLAYDPDRDMTVAVLANQNGGAAVQLGRQLVALGRAAGADGE